MDIEQLEAYTAAHCDYRYDYSIFARFLVLCQFFPLYLTIGLYAVALTVNSHELYYKLFSLGITFNWFLNWLLIWLFRVEPRFQGCGIGYSMPSWHAQHVFFFYTTVVSYAYIKGVRLRLRNVIFLNISPVLVCVSRYILGYNTILELAVGACVGVSFGVIYQYIIIVYLKPKIKYILKIPCVTYFGIQDTLITNDGAEQSTPPCYDSFYCELCKMDTYHSGIHC